MQLIQPLFIGVMTGTSCDGIDIAIVRYADKSELLHFTEHPMPQKLREPLLRLASPGMNEIDAMGELDRILGDGIAKAVLDSIEQAGLRAEEITAIGNHGQTIRHRPQAQHPFTMQIGSAAAIAEKTGITTISDFRSRDMAAGGQGAPLVPFAHRELFASENQNTAVVNIGGIANVSWLGANGEVTGFDTGPGNMVMDGLMLALSDGRNGFDPQGELAATGKICTPLLETLMDHPFLHRPPPKSTGREEFGGQVIDQILSWPDLCDADRMATASAFTVQNIISGMAYFPEKATQWYICGGGVRNTHLMHQLKEMLSPAQVDSTDASGIPPQAVEAVCFAILARQTLMGETNTLSEVTGASHAVCGGQITPGRNWQGLLRNIPAWIR
jgi:anhydro-N-acetylmuramic acid kinase